MRVLFANPPWYQVPTEDCPGWRGVRAGSRWPHTHDYQNHNPVNGFCSGLVGGYIPFPVWLAGAGALAKRHGFDAYVRDSIALGETYENYLDFVKEFRPDVIVQETSTATIAEDIDMVQKCREMLGKLTAVFTGLHHEIEDPNFLKNEPRLDYLVYGEYEFGTAYLLKALRDGTPLNDVPNLIFRQGDEVIKTPFKLHPMSELPWADRDDTPAENYFDGVCGLERPQLQLMATRGCPYGCIFCAWPQMLFKGKYRKRDPQDVVDEILDNFKKVDYKSFYIDDDTVNVDRHWVRKLAKLIKDSGLGKTPWGTMGRADLMDDETLHALKDAGLFSIKYGVESASQEILDEAQKNIKLDRVITAIRKTAALGIKVHLTFTIGLPSDTVETIEDTIRLACDLPATTVQFSIATPYPGTKMYTMYEQNGWLTSHDWADYNGSVKAVSRTKNFTGEQLEFYVREGYRRFAEKTLSESLDQGVMLKRIDNHLSQLIKPKRRVLVLQSAHVIFTRRVVQLLQQLDYDVHVMTQERFADSFRSLVDETRLHRFATPLHFRFDELEHFANRLRAEPGFAGAVVPYSDLNGAGYEQVERIAKAASGRLLMGITIEGKILQRENAGHTRVWEPDMEKLSSTTEPLENSVPIDQQEEPVFSNGARAQ